MTNGNNLHFEGYLLCDLSWNTALSLITGWVTLDELLNLTKYQYRDCKISLILLDSQDN